LNASLKETPLDLNEYFLKALDLIENTTQNVFITGRAGTGKSTLLNYFRNATKKKVVFLAPTGVAAVNIKGQTIHSFFQFRPSVTLQEVKRLKDKGNQKKDLYKKLDALVIDEISMVRADLLDCVDKFMRLNGKSPSKPFGGAQVIFIGDLYQLAPVVRSQEKQIFHTHYETPYFFSAHVFNDFDMELIELEKIYRQKDEAYIKLLNAVRNNSVTDEGLQKINTRCLPDFEKEEKDFYVYLTTTNDQASLINDKELQKIDRKHYHLPAFIEGEFSKEYYPTSPELQVKVGAQVMMLNNDYKDRWINGTIGKITKIAGDEEGRIALSIQMDHGKIYNVYPYTWEISSFSLEKGHLISKIVGTFTQYPLMLAWAITIHKSQGKTFEKVIIDLGRGTFAHGQAYVALSRCTSLEGIVLKKEFLKEHIWMDHTIIKFLTKFQYQKSEQVCSTIEKIELIKKAIEVKGELHIVYLKANDEKFKRTIKPFEVGEMSYAGKKYLGVKGYCLKRREERVFRVDRILEIKKAAG